LINLISKIDQNELETPKYQMSLIEAELTKVTLNCYLTVKISFANMIGDMADQLGLDPNLILSAVGCDPRIGSRFFQPGSPYGGPCFPRDTKALLSFGSLFGIELPIIKAAEEVNALMMNKKKKELFCLSRQSNEVKFENLDFKKGTYIYSGSPNLIVAQFLEQFGVKITVAPEFMDQMDMLNDNSATD
jgi:UDPglucose 6-dehydrogenase